MIPKFHPHECRLVFSPQVFDSHEDGYPSGVERWLHYATYKMSEKRRKIRLPTPSDDARYLDTVKVEYLLHPMFGQTVRDVRCRAGGMREGHLRIETSQDRQCVPSWMTDPTRCALLTFGLQPFASEQALRQLDALLTSLDERDLPSKLNS